MKSKLSKPESSSEDDGEFSISFGKNPKNAVKACVAPGRFKCPICATNFTRNYNLTAHVKKCAKPLDPEKVLAELNPFTCHHCHFRCQKKSVLAKHIIKKHLPKLQRNPKVNRCDKCGKNFSTQSNLYPHAKICGLPLGLKLFFRPKPFTCVHCEGQFQSKSVLKEHVKAKHLPRDPNLNKCMVCEKSFAYKSNMRRHMKFCGRPSELRPKFKKFSCDHCEFRTKYKACIKDHIARRHLSQRPRKTPIEMKSCYFCGYKHRFKSVLEVHIRNNHLPHDPSAKCEKCGKVFSRVPYAKAHSKVCGLPLDLRRPPESKLLYCADCPFKTDRKSVITEHILAWHFPPEFSVHKCERCQKVYSYRPELRRHLKYCDADAELEFDVFACGDCGRRYRNHKLLMRHIQDKHAGFSK